ncbi:MAG: 1-(5-phosphoribosyl)-5-[(5-phosphoribosylamino)methylideneamino] imidazole-4-carboxamide isomerase [Archangium sp.]|nr:1-(5-phosphoribosyl)-5-[(5-phosphoribosylamino)methylideneamino] imidazole-4-carboxamide isomerase [Archangium sp.]MDP3152957.1 1-(5-phosphoribosyl)-5-[(5-phosphoribosylamino)methylideneamino] imidazole-4-carboxamide isomerase [Archangium sp.]MDP3569076.1 1-(5-phosphoribosyl)-5-[(5-phosphoribosylamino)methylideneamino] imidazole-4-carboxamide isomerase [Archangium sp.]
MKVFPALDLREGACVQLVGGRYEDERIRLPEPLAIAEQWAASGLTAQHVVDLDAAMGRGSNFELIAGLSKVPGLELQVGGGVRDEAAIERLLELGITRVVVGTRAVEDAAWLETVATRFPLRLVVAADVRGTQVVTRGWTQTSALSIEALLARLSPLPLAGVLVTAVHVEGQLQGIDAALMKSVCSSTTTKVIASGGITTMEDLRTLSGLGAFAAVVGMALYTGRLEARALSQEFPS